MVNNQSLVFHLYNYCVNHYYFFEIEEMIHNGRMRRRFWLKPVMEAQCNKGPVLFWPIKMIKDVRDEHRRSILTLVPLTLSALGFVCINCSHVILALIQSSLF